MKSLCEAVFAAYNGNAGLKSMAGMFMPWAPEGQKQPFITFVPLTGRAEGTMKPGGIKYLDRVDIQFSVFCDEWELDTAWLIVSVLRGVYDNNVLGGTLSDGKKVIMAKRLNNGTLVDQPEGGFMIALEYEYTIQGS